ncbi:hypothetical protein FF1_031214 [Malus domestica]
MRLVGNETNRPNFNLHTYMPLADWVKSSGAKQFLYISSAGIYKPTEEPPHVEWDVVKADASHVAVEMYIGEIFGSCSFRKMNALSFGVIYDNVMAQVCVGLLES